MNRVEEDARRLVAPLRPRDSLASGSVLVLITLFLPIGYQSCGPETKGYELLQGKGDWPTFVGITLSEYFSPLFYGVLLLLAAGTAVLCVMSLWRPAVFQSRSLVQRAGILSGILSLFLLSDVAAILPIGLDEYGAVAGALIILSCLLPGFYWPKGVYWRWFGLLIVLVSALAASGALNWIAGDVPAWILLGTWAIYALGPQALWWAHLSGRWKSGEDWIRIRRGLVAFYFPAAIANAWFIVVAVREGLWGFSPCCFGLHLISLGYLRLAKESKPILAESPPSGP